MDSVDYLRTKLSSNMQEIQNLYRHRPPIYDIAIGVFRTVAVGLATGTAMSLIIPLIKPLSKVDTPESDSALRTLSFLGIIGITAYFAYSETSSLIRWCKLKKISQDQSKEKVVLICRSKSDWNGAINRLSGKEFELLQELAKTHGIVVKKINSVEDINKAIDQIDQQNRKITTLFLAAHGDSDCIALGKEIIIGHESLSSRINFRKKIIGRDDYGIFIVNKSQCVGVDKIDFDKLDPKADIILLACDTGINNIHQLNVAEWLQFYVGQDKRVFAPNGEVSHVEIDQTAASNGEVSYRLKNWWEKDVTNKLSYPTVVEKANSLYPSPQ